MAKQLITTLSEFPIPDTLSTEVQVIADIIAHPDTLMEAERIVTEDMFTSGDCKDAFNALRQMAKEGLVIDLPSAFGRISRELMQKGIIPMMQNVGGAMTAIQHYSTLKGFDIKRKCYFKGMELIMGACDSNILAQDLINKATGMADTLRKEIDADKGMQHISQVLNDVADTLQELQHDRQNGKMLRTPTGFNSLNFYTYGGFNAGNLVILAARPSVGKTAVMLQMAKAAATAGHAVNIFSLEMTNQELVQRFLTSESTALNQWSMARGDVEWTAFEQASKPLASKPIYLNDSARTIDEISSRITLNSMAKKCDIAFIDYLGLIKMKIKGGNLSQAIAEVTSDLKALAKACRIPIVLLCQLNRASASEKRPPEMYDLRDSGGIEQDADIVLMLERASDDEDDKEVNMWVRKNRQGKAGNVCITIVANDTYSAFYEKDELRSVPPLTSPNNDFENDQDFPF